MDENFNKIIGLTPSNITIIDTQIKIVFSDGSSCIFYHEQDCCEDVRIDDINGNFADLIGHPILVAEERISTDDHESITWTFYTFRGVGGSVDVRWCGSSNGCYSESVNFCFWRVNN